MTLSQNLSHCKKLDSETTLEMKEFRRIPVLVNVVCYIVIVSSTALLKFLPLEPPHVGFFCDDKSIQYPYRAESINDGFLVFSCIGSSIFMVFALEVTYGWYTRQHDVSTDEKRYNGLKFGASRAVVVVVCLLYGNCISYLVVEIFKISFGSLRPCFLAVCQPVPDVTSRMNCSGNFIDDVKCTNPNTLLVQEMRKSFLSGHSSVAGFNTLFISLYLHHRLPSSTPRFVAPLLQCAAVSWTVFVSATRILENYHYFSDVAAGIVEGAVWGFFTMYKICPRFIRHPPAGGHLETLHTPFRSKHTLVPMCSSTVDK